MWAAVPVYLSGKIDTPTNFARGFSDTLESEVVKGELYVRDVHRSEFAATHLEARVWSDANYLRRLPEREQLERERGVYF